MSSRTPSEENVVLDVIKESLSTQSKTEAHQEDSTANEPNKPMRRNKAFVEKNNDFPDVPIAPDDEFIFTVPRNYLMSPYLASNEILKQFPKTNIVSTIVDPCLDDCIEFGKKLRSLEVVTEVDVLGALNHGFLNFAGVSDEIN